MNQTVKTTYIYRNDNNNITTFFTENWISRKIFIIASKRVINFLKEFGVNIDKDYFSRDDLSKLIQLEANRFPDDYKKTNVLVPAPEIIKALLPGENNTNKLMANLEYCFNKA